MVPYKNKKVKKILKKVIWIDNQTNLITNDNKIFKKKQNTNKCSTYSGLSNSVVF